MNRLDRNLTTCGPSRSTDAAFAAEYRHRVRFTREVFDPENPTLRDLFSEPPARTVVFIDEGVATAWPDLTAAVTGYAAAHADRLALIGEPAVVAGGEGAKNGWTVYETVVRAVNDAGICRHSYVVAIGGGAVLDVVGFAASTAHRGVRLIRLPTTTLAQADAGIGVKNGINAFGKKNFLGTFSVPWAVVNDERFLTTLDDRDWRSGLSEAVKVALLKDAGLFERMAATAPHLRGRDLPATASILQRSAVLHLDHIATGGDPFEWLNARPLDFGHWSAHKLEQVSGFEIRHGEAVAIGIALDVMYSAAAGLLPDEVAERIIQVLGDLGLPVYHDTLADHDRLLEGLTEFREHLGGRLTITLLKDIGRPVDVHEMDPERIRAAVACLGGRKAAPLW